MDVYTLSPREIAELRVVFTVADREGARIRVAIDGGLKLDAGGGWSLPRGTDTTGRS